MDSQKTRQKPGRKPIEDKKIPITLYIKTSIVEGVGNGELEEGKETSKKIAIKSISDYYEENKDKETGVG